MEKDEAVSIAHRKGKGKHNYCHSRHHQSLVVSFFMIEFVDSCCIDIDSIGN